MRKALLLLSIITFIQFHSKITAQTTIIGLPIVGDTIDKEEKFKYVLFDEIPTIDYLFSVISKRNSDTLLTHYRKTGTTEKRIDLKYISLMQNNITKLNTYYKSLADQKYSTIVKLQPGRKSKSSSKNKFTRE